MGSLRNFTKHLNAGTLIIGVANCKKICYYASQGPFQTTWLTLDFCENVPESRIMGDSLKAGTWLLGIV